MEGLTEAQIALWAKLNGPNGVLTKPGIAKEDLTETYNKWSEDYEQDCQHENYKGPETVVKYICNHITDREKRANSVVLDVAAGNGLVGQLLWDEGFRTLDGLEPARVFSKKAKARGIYRNIVHEYIGANQPLSLKNGEYDVVVSVGALCENHMPTSSIDDMIKLVKPGGIVCFALVEDDLNTATDFKDGKFEGRLKHFVDKGEWRLLARNTFNYIYFTYTGLVYLYEKLHNVNNNNIPT